MTSGSDPGISRRRVRTELREARVRLERTQQEVADDLDWSLSKMIRIESGVVTISTSDLKALMDSYGIVEPESRQRLIEEARRSRQRAWWFPYRQVVRSQLPQLLAYESEASEIQTYSPSLITALLQTPAYARELRKQTIHDEEQISLLVELLTKRQERLFAADAPECTFIIDIAPLRRRVGGLVDGPGLMAEQLAHIKKIAQLPNVTVRILPDEAGAHPLMNGPVVLMAFDDVARRQAIFLEGIRDDVVNHEDSELIKRFSDRFKQVEKLALSPAESTVVLDNMIAELEAIAGSSEAAARSDVQDD